MNPGQMNMKVSAYRYIESVDETLSTTEKTPTLLCTFWASVQPRTGSLLRGREAGTMLSQTTHTIIARSQSVKDLVDSDYITWTDEYEKAHKFDIDYILPPAGGLYTTIYAEEVLTND